MASLLMFFLAQAGCWIVFAEFAIPMLCCETTDKILLLQVCKVEVGVWEK